ncbi:MAG: heparan-alpha-glucosaminide N-acetyltransferase domain-containing protein [Pyrinomonadaceae bacterium]
MNTSDPAEILKRRIYSVDLLRGIVMMIMMLDHVREFVHSGALLADPTDPGTTTVPLFFTRWITHFCAPIFVFLSGVSIYLQRMNGKAGKELSWFLLTRGLWLIVLEFTVIRFLIVFNLDYASFFGMAQVIWVIGVSMIAMAGLIYLPLQMVGIAGVLMIVLHNLLDRLSVPPQIAFTGQADLGQSLWIILHGIGIVPIGSTGSGAFFAYALIPWIGVMMAGYALGSVFAWETERRRRMLLILGVAATVLFVGIRLINVYGDGGPWTTRSAYLERVATEQRSGAPENLARPPLNPNPTEAYTILSFLNTNKYPPSLLFLLMTLGPGLILLWLSDGIDGSAIWQEVCITFGRVPMFYYLLQWAWAHSAGVVLAYFAGIDTSYLFKNLLEMGQFAPPGHGFSLPVVYAVWIAGLIAMYPLCRWWGNLKARNKHWALSYL